MCLLAPQMNEQRLDLKGSVTSFKVNFIRKIEFDEVRDNITEITLPALSFQLKELGKL